MKNSFILLACGVFIFSVNSVVAQSENSKYVSNSLVKLNFFVPGISFEKALGNTTTLYLSPYFDFLVTDEGEGGGLNFYKAPSLDVDLRNYYNIKRRTEKGRMTDHNNANYLSLKYVLRYTLIEPNEGYAFLNQAALSWGWQHNYSNGIGFDLKLGFRYSFDLESNWYYYPLDLFGQLSIGFRLGKK